MGGGGGGSCGSGDSHGGEGETVETPCVANGECY